MKTFLFASTLATAVTLGLPTQAAAQDFSGPRIEVRGGYQTVNLEAEFEDDDDSEGGSEGSLTYGAEIGFDVQASPSFVVGAYAGYALSNVERCAEVFGDDEGCLEAGRTITLGVRAGVPIGTSTLVYGKVGYSNTELDLRYEGVTDLLDFELSESGGGWHAGGGLEFNLGENLYAKAEYVFTNSSGTFGEDDESVAISADRHDLLLGVGFRF